MIFFNFIIFLFLFIIGISMLINYFTTIITSTEISTGYFLILFIGTVFLSLSILLLTIVLKIDLEYYILPYLLIVHLALYNYCYSFLLTLFVTFYFIENFLFYNKTFLKILDLFGIKTRYIFHPSLKFNKQPIHKNLKLLKFILFLSYFLSILCFKFFFEINLITEYKLNDITKKSIDTYSNIFIISIIPVFISYFKNIEI